MLLKRRGERLQTAAGRFLRRSGSVYLRWDGQDVGREGPCHALRWHFEETLAKLAGRIWMRKGWILGRCAVRGTSRGIWRIAGPPSLRVSEDRYFQAWDGQRARLQGQRGLEFFGGWSEKGGSVRLFGGQSCWRAEEKRVAALSCLSVL